MKPLFKKGQQLEYPRECRPNEQVQIIKAYPAGHKYANATSNFYLIESSGCGQDVWSESTVLDGLDLFQHIALLPKTVKTILRKYEKIWEESYQNCADMLKDTEAIGYTFDYYLDATPYNLRKK